MGFESFRVELRGGSASHAQADEVVRLLPHARPDHESIASQGSSYYTLDDRSHIIEVEVADSPLRVSCRFTLCHPPSIGPAFLNLVRELMSRLGMEATIRDDVRPEHSQGFSVARFPEFADIASGYIASRRAEWVANFGGSTFAATTPEIYEKIILPKCVPVAG